MAPTRTILIMNALLLLTSRQRIYSHNHVVAAALPTSTTTTARNQIRRSSLQHYFSYNDSNSCTTTTTTTLQRKFNHNFSNDDRSPLLRRLSTTSKPRTSATVLLLQQQSSWRQRHNDDNDGEYGDDDDSRLLLLNPSKITNYNSTVSSYSSHVSSRRTFTTSLMQSTLLTTAVSPTYGQRERLFSTTTPSSTKSTEESYNKGSTIGSISFPNEDTINAMFTLPKVPDRINLLPNQRLVALGDVHGDYDQLCRILRIANLVDDNLNWIGGSDSDSDSGDVPGTICIQCGDVVDRGPYELKCLELLTKLSQQAAAKQDGSLLTMLYGNHETLWMEGDFRYADQGSESTAQEEFERCFGIPLDNSKFGSKPASSTDNNNDDWRKLYMNNDPSRWVAYEPCGYLSKPLLANMKVAIIVGRSLLVHAGLTKQHLDEYSTVNDDDKGKGKKIDGLTSLETMNRVANEWLINPPYQYDGIMNMMNRLLQVKQKDETITNDVYEEYMKQIAHYRAYVISQSMPSCLGGGVNGNESPVWMRLYSSPKDKPPSNPILAQETLGTLYFRLFLDHFFSFFVSNLIFVLSESESSLSLSDLTQIDAVLAELDVDRMIMGHTPQERINSALQDKAWRIDVGSSIGMGNNSVEALEIVALEDGTEQISILTESGRIPAKKRQVKIGKK